MIEQIIFSDQFYFYNNITHNYNFKSYNYFISKYKYKILFI